MEGLETEPVGIISYSVLFAFMTTAPLSVNSK